MTDTAVTISGPKEMTASSIEAITLVGSNYDVIHPGLTDLVLSVHSEGCVHPTGAADEKLSAYVADSGRLKRAPKPKVVKTVSTEAQLGESFYVRPNGDKYFTRTWGDHTDVMVLRKARELSSYVLLYGAPGCGKTALIEAAFAGESGGLYTILGSGDTEVADLVGGYVQTPSGGFLWEDGPLLKAAETGGVLLIDEVGLIDPKVLSIVYGLMDGRREYTVTANPERGTVRAADGFYVVAATNPNAPGVRLSEALLSRFSMQAEMTTDWSLARRLGASTPVVTAAQNLAKKQQSGETSWAPQMRELLAFRDLEVAFGTPFAISNLLAAAPEIDRAIVADVLTRVFGHECRPAKI
jgi:nitric oxide reductase NorQ protein